MQQVLIDTDILIDYLRGKANLCQIFEELWGYGLGCVSSLSVYEIYAGVRPNEDIYVTKMLAPMRVLDLTVNIAKIAGKRYCDYRGKGITLSGADCMIAATAIANKCSLFTQNVKHFPDIQMYELP